MARPIWTGSVAFGLVSVPVSLYTATEDKTVHFNQFQAGTSDRIRYKLVNERTGREVDLADIVRGYEVSKGDYVVVTDEELEAVDPGQSRTIDIADFVDLAEIDPIYFQKAYYLKQHLATIRAGEADVLALETMFFADEVRDPRDEIGDLPVWWTWGTRCAAAWRRKNGGRPVAVPPDGAKRRPRRKQPQAQGKLTVVTHRLPARS